MILLPLLSTLSTPLSLLILILSLASALYQLSLLVEEHSALTRTVLTRLIWTLIAVLPLLWLLDGFPAPLVLLAMGSHVVYLGSMREWPVVRIWGGWFGGSCREFLAGPLTLLRWLWRGGILNAADDETNFAVLVLTNHLLFTSHFSTLRLQHSASTRSSTADPYAEYRASPFSSLTSFLSPRSPTSTTSATSRSSDGSPSPSLTEVSTFFALFVWLVPMALFVSLSAGDNVLPTTIATSNASGTGTPGLLSPIGGGPVGGMGFGGLGAGSEGDGRTWRGHARADSVTGTVAGGGRRRNAGLVRQLVERGWEWGVETGEVVGLWGGGRARGGGGGKRSV